MSSTIWTPETARAKAVERMRILRGWPSLVSSSLGVCSSNCFGTVAWTYGFEVAAAELWRAEKGEDPFHTGDGCGNYVILTPETRRPGYIGHDIIELFLKKKLKLVDVSRAVPGDIWTLKYANMYCELCGHVLRHAGILQDDGCLLEKPSYGVGEIIRFDRTPKDIISELKGNYYEGVEEKVWRVG